MSPRASGRDEARPSPSRTAVGVSKTVCPLSPRPPRLRVRFLRGLCGLCARISTPLRLSHYPRSVSGGFGPIGVSTLPSTALGVGGRAARAPASCVAMSVRALVASEHRSSEQPGNRPSDHCSARRDAAPPWRPRRCAVLPSRMTQPRAAEMCKCASVKTTSFQYQRQLILDTCTLSHFHTCRRGPHGSCIYPEALAEGLN